MKKKRTLSKEQVEQNKERRFNDSNQKKMSKGAQNIARMIKSRTHWGNKELWGNDNKE